MPIAYSNIKTTQIQKQKYGMQQRNNENCDFEKKWLERNQL